MSDASWTAVAAVAASSSALLAAIYTWLTFRLVTGQAEPKIVVYVCGDPDRQTILMIRIANIGRDVAEWRTTGDEAPVRLAGRWRRVQGGQPLIRVYSVN